MMKPAIAVCAALLVATVVCAQSVIGPPAPRSRLAREVLLLFQGPAQPERITKPGRYQFDLPCASVPGATERLTLEVTPQTAAADAQEGYRDCTPDEVRRLAQEGAEARVRFSDALAAVQLFPQPQPLPMAEGEPVQLGGALRTAGGAMCLVPADRQDLAQFLHRAGPGDAVTVTGTLLPGPNGIAPGGAVLVDGLSARAEAQAPAEPAWTVKVLCEGREVGAFSDAGDHPLVLPCAQRAGAVEQATIRLREVKAVDLQVGGHAVTAELADTPQSRSWGLQGRSALAPSEGMLFYFERPLRPTFVMKTVSFPLAIAFIRADGVILNIEKRNPGDTQGAAPPAPVSYVLEMQQDWFDRNGVGPGARAAIP